MVILNGGIVCSCELMWTYFDIAVSALSKGDRNVWLSTKTSSSELIASKISVIFGRSHVCPFLGLAHMKIDY